MDINENNSSVNSFIKGMNSDTSLDLVSNEQYVFGENIRVTTNNLILALINSNNTEGIITPVESPIALNISIYKYNYTDDSWESPGDGGLRECLLVSSPKHCTYTDIEITGILATAYIEDLGIIVVKYNQDVFTNLWAVIRVLKTGDNDVSMHCVFKAGYMYPVPKDVQRFSVVLNKETITLHKLYIADGAHEVMQIRVTDENGNPNAEYLKKNIQADLLISNHLFPINTIVIANKISGKLKTGLVQYCYRYYKKNGIYSRLSPLTNKILVIDPTHTKETGNAEDTETSIGFRLKIANESSFIAPFDNVQIYRLYYIKAGENAEVDLIFDGKINSDNEFFFEDTGEPALQSLSIEEFSSLNSWNVVPKVLLQNQNYLFAGNVKDTSMMRVDEDDKNKFVVDAWNKDHEKFVSEDDPSADDGYLYDLQGNYGGSSENGFVSYRLITTDVNLHNNCIFTNNGNPIIQANEAPVVKSSSSKNIVYLDDKKTQAYIKDTNAYFHERNILCDSDISINYDNIFTSSLLRSLRRDEVYRYGIVLYDSHGRRSDVLYMADVRVPSLKDSGISRVIDKDGKVIYEDGSLSEEPVINPEIVTYTNNLSTYNFYESFYDDISGPVHVRFGKNYNSDVDDSIESIRNEKLSKNSAQVYSGETYNIRRNVTYSWMDYDYDQNPISYEMNESDFYTTYGVKLKFDQSIVNYQGSVIKTNDVCERNINDHIEIVNDHTERIFVLVNRIRAEYGTPTSYPNTFENVKAVVTYTIEVNRNSEENASSETESEDTESYRDASLYANPIGIEFKVNLPGTFINKYNIVGYQIVRCEKSFNYTKNILQCALSRPVRQLISYYNDSSEALAFSPYYPMPFITSQKMWYNHIEDYPYDKTGEDENNGVANNHNNYDLYLIFSPEILYQRQDILSMLSQGLCEINVLNFRYGNDVDRDSVNLGTKIAGMPAIGYGNDTYYILRDRLPFKYHKKSYDSHLFFDYFDYTIPNEDKNFKLEIKHISDVKNPNWEEGFSEPIISGKHVLTAIKQYKSFEISVGNRQYVNWICQNMYDMRVGENAEGSYGYEQQVYTYPDNETRDKSAMGWIGPGPVCFVVNTEENNTLDLIDAYDKHALGTCICNIQHPWSVYSGTTEYQKQYDMYYGFGNFTHVLISENFTSVFDGDVYIMPHEFTSMFKSYDFNSIYDSFESTQIVYYITMESKVNGYFDYGMNYRNTLSKNLMLEPGTIVGVASQDRPLHSYNQIYSDNNTSNDIFNVLSLIEHENIYPQRTVYSLVKTNGELIDNWGVFKSADYIDVDSRYGELTNLLTANDILYYWLTSGFGKFSINERSLITDQNSNTIQLGQSGVLQRNDYIDTTYGMRKMDFSAIAVAKDIYWIDILNKAVVLHRLGTVLNYGERLNVQNIINKYISEELPLINYDIQNNELLCLMLLINKNEYKRGVEEEIIPAQLVFNTKFECATSIYTRDYIAALVLENKLIGVDNAINLHKFNYISSVDESNGLMSPIIISFVINKNPSIAKVFDNLQIVTLKRLYDDQFVKDYLKDKYYTFTSDIQDGYYGNINKERITDREGNILYAIPRCNIDSKGDISSFVEYGRRIRGKWLRIDVRDDKPKYEFSISHIITKFRQSYS